MESPCRRLRGFVGGTCSPSSRRTRWTIFLFTAYRSEEAYGGTPFDCVEDTKSAMRYVRQHAGKWNIDSGKIAAGGGSAGGHLAAAVALLPGLNSPSDPDVSCIPNALVLFNPVYDNNKDGYGYSRVQDRWREISPMRHIGEGAPQISSFLARETRLFR